MSKQRGKQKIAENKKQSERKTFRLFFVYAENVISCVYESSLETINRWKKILKGQDDRIKDQINKLKEQDDRLKEQDQVIRKLMKKIEQLENISAGSQSPS